MTAPGLEEMLADEIAKLTGRRGETSSGGVAFVGGLKDMRRVNLWSRIANRVVVRVDEFHASTFHEMERKAKQVDWGSFVASGQSVRFRVTCRKSKLYHSDAVAQRLAAAVKAKVGGNKHVVASADDEDDEESGDTFHNAQLFVVRIIDDMCSISADSSGELLHRRGYRQAVAKAPLRETIAAAMVIGSGWDMKAPFVDPMCGAGTIAIEAALMARRMAPGLNRRFAFENWTRHDAAAWSAEIDAARAEQLEKSPARIVGSDRDEGAIAAAIANAERARVSAEVQFDVRPLSAADVPDEPCWIVTNPPYGMRLGEGGQLRDLYAKLGKMVRARGGYRVALLSADSELEDQMKLSLREVFRTSNGGIPVHLMIGESE